MKRGRDPKTGRFLPGNKIAVGNRGNRQPKWGNKNAVKHGLYETITLPRLLKDGWLYLYQSNGRAVKIGPTAFNMDDEGNILIRDDVAENLRENGFVLNTWG